MSLKHAILGFLEIRSLTGYDLKKGFDGSVQHFWPADQAQIYRTLNKLSETGLVSVELIPQEGKPDRKVYHITENGRSELHTWLSSPLPPLSEREPQMVRIFFSGFTDDETMLSCLQDSLAQEHENLAVTQAILAGSKQQVESLPTPEEQRIGFFQLLTVERAILHHQAQIEWLTNLITRLENQDFTIQG